LLQLDTDFIHHSSVQTHWLVLRCCGFFCYLTGFFSTGEYFGLLLWLCVGKKFITCYILQLLSIFPLTWGIQRFQWQFSVMRF